MSYQKLLQLMFGTMLLTLLLAGCNTPTPVPRVGHWKGEGVSFTVTEDKTVTDFEITISNCLVTLSEKIPIDSSSPPGSFAINPKGELRGSDAETATNFRAEAKFDSETTLSGTYNVQLCGGWALLNQTNIVWTAEWQER